jgi:ABC-type uncharacterized transport system substrate-binding protein
VLLSISAIFPQVAIGQRLERRLCIVLAIKPSTEYQNALAAFNQALASLGWKRSDNLRVDQFWSAGDQGYEHALAVAKDVLALNPDIILAQSAVVVSALHSRTQSIPVVFVHVADPVASGIVSNIARPDGNITGVTNTVPSLGGKWLQLLKEMVPDLGRAAMLVYPQTQQPDRAFFLNPFEEAARSLNVSIVKGEVTNIQDIETVFADLGAPTRSCRRYPPFLFCQPKPRDRRARGAFQGPGIVSLPLLRRTGRIDVLRRQQRRSFQAGRSLRKQPPARSKARRFAGSATHPF